MVPKGSALVLALLGFLLCACSSGTNQQPFLVVGRITGVGLGTTGDTLSCVQYRSFETTVQVCEPTAPVEKFAPSDRAAYETYKKKADVAKQFEEQALPVVSQVSGLLLANPTSAGNVLVAVRNSAELAQRTAKQMYELEPQFGDINAITKMSQSWAAISQSLEELIRASVDVEKQTAELTAQISEAKLRARAAQDAADTASAAAQRAMVGLPATGDPAFLRALADRERDTLLQQRYRSAATAIESSVARAADLRNANRVVADLQAKTTTGQPATNSAQLALSSFVTANLQQAVSQAAKDGDSAIAASRKFRNSALEGLVKTAPAIL